MIKKFALRSHTFALMILFSFFLLFGFSLCAQKINNKTKKIITSTSYLGNIFRNNNGSIPVTERINNDTIYSTSAGGQWLHDSTWVGNIIPTAKDPVVIQGLVGVDYDSSSKINAECKSLTIRKHAVISCKNDGPKDTLRLTIDGDLINNGNISSQIDNSSGNLSGFGIVVKGNIINNGQINEQVHIDLVNEKQQTLTSNNWGNEIWANCINVKNGQDLLAGSDLNFIGTCFRFQNGNFIIDTGYTVYFREIAGGTTAHIEKVHIKGGGTIGADDGFYFCDSSTVENIKLKGTIQVKNHFIIKDHVYLTGTLQQANSNLPDTININNNFVNEGYVKDNPNNSGYLVTKIFKNIVNNGSWDNSWVIMNGIKDQEFINNGKVHSNFQLNANVPQATTFQWFKDGIAIDGAKEKNYKYYRKDSTNNSMLYGEYYCKTDAGDSRKIKILNNHMGIIFEENFDGAVFPPAGWTRKITDKDYTWTQSNPAAFPFNKIDSTNVYSATCDWDIIDQDEWLITPKLLLPFKNVVLEFYIGADTYWRNDATVKLFISNDDGEIWHKLWNASEIISLTRDWFWKKVTINLSTYARNDSVLLAWQYVGNDGQIMAIDNVKIREDITAISQYHTATQPLLLQNYPNPFSRQTSIPFILKQRSSVRITIFNSLGQKITEPVSGIMSAGKHTVKLKIPSLKAGIYYYQLMVNGHAVTKQMVIY